MTTKKDDFIFTMEALKQQNDYDKVWAQTMTTTLGADVIPIYNNGILVQTLISEMCSWFRDPQEAKMEISRFMYELDFGRCKGCEVISVEDLWESLSSVGLDTKITFTKTAKKSYDGIKPSPFLIDEIGVWDGWKYAKRPETRDDMEVKEESNVQEIESILKEFRDWDRSWNAKGPRPDRPISVDDFAKQLSKKYEVKKKK